MTVLNNVQNISRGKFKNLEGLIAFWTSLSDTEKGTIVNHLMEINVYIIFLQCQSLHTKFKRQDTSDSVVFNSL